MDECCVYVIVQALGRRGKEKKTNAGRMENPPAPRAQTRPGRILVALFTLFISFFVSVWRWVVLLLLATWGLGLPICGRLFALFLLFKGRLNSSHFRLSMPDSSRN